MNNPIWSLMCVETGAVVVEQLEIADGPWSRFWGWQFRSQVPANRGLLIVPCAAVHTCWLRFSLDLIFLDSCGRVLDVQKCRKPWRMAWTSHRTHAILEQLGGASTVQVGQTLRIKLTGQLPEHLPRSLKFLAATPQAPSVS